jgi:hypothetical protein
LSAFRGLCEAVEVSVKVSILALLGAGMLEVFSIFEGTTVIDSSTVSTPTLVSSEMRDGKIQRVDAVPGGVTEESGVVSTVSNVNRTMGK